MTNENMEEVPLSKSYLLLNHGPVTLVGSAFGGRKNVMAAAWVMPLDFDPARVALVIDRQTFTRELVDASGEFALSIPCRDVADKVLAVGGVSGRDGDKLARCGLDSFAGSAVGAPLIRGCAAWLECRVIEEVATQRRYDLFVADVLAARADPRQFSKGRWLFTGAHGRTMHYQAGGAFFETGDLFIAQSSSE